MLALAMRHFHLQDKFAVRYAIGMTAGLVHQLAHRISRARHCRLL